MEPVQSQKCYATIVRWAGSRLIECQVKQTGFQDNMDIARFKKLNDEDVECLRRCLHQSGESASEGTGATVFPWRYARNASSTTRLSSFLSQ